MKNKPWTFGMTPPSPTIRDIREVLEAEIEVQGQSFRETDGVIRNTDAIWTIVCLRAALELIPKRGKKAKR